MFTAFLVAAFTLAATPGPGVMYVVARTVAQGRIAGVASALGVACGNLANAAGASLGLAALIAASATAYTVVKLLGAAYLVWLGWRLIRARPPTAAASALPNATPVSKLFRDGALVALLNPKTALFFMAFLPQFIAADAPAWPQALAFGALFVAIAAATDLAYVLLAHGVAARFGHFGSVAVWGRRAGGVVLIGLGLAAAWTGRPAPLPPFRS